MPKENKNSINASQDFVPIKEIKDGIVVLDNGTLVSISIVTSINISLKSTDEHNAIISAFHNFLNLLEFPVQIYVQSRKLDKPFLMRPPDRITA